VVALVALVAATMMIVGVPPGPRVSPADAVATPGPNGKLAFSRDPGSIWVMNADGTGATKIADYSGADYLAWARDPAWSPDGTKIVFARWTAGTWVMNADGSNPVQLTVGAPGEMDFVPSFSPDGTKIVFTRSPDFYAGNAVWVMNADGTSPHQIWHPADSGDPTGQGASSGPQYSPDGTQVLFSWRIGHALHDDLLIMNSDGTGIRPLLGVTPVMEVNPDWSPDGRHIVYSELPAGAGVAALRVVDADGSNRRVLTNGDDNGSTWSPDGTTIAFTRVVGGAASVYRIAANGNPGDESLLGDPSTWDTDLAWQRAPRLYRFAGFFEPIDNGMLNTATAGQAIPVKWQLTDASGLPVADPMRFVALKSQAVPCAEFGGNPTDAIEEYAAGSSGLQYLGDGNWQTNWKTPKAYASSCRRLFVQFSDDYASPTAMFLFR
jgi:TolB protein